MFPDLPLLFGGQELIAVKAAWNFFWATPFPKFLKLID
jgi:hypothetical protein